MFHRRTARPGGPTTTPRPTRLAAGLTACAAALALPATASAHGLGAEAANRSTLEFVPTGIEHMLLGWDHLLFVFGVILLAGKVRRAAKLISLFALGHSLTLIVATLAGWTLSATLVDVVVAFSVVLVGVLAIRGRPTNWRPIQAGVFGFGLIHGLGLATRFDDLGVPDDGLLGKVVAFNVGIELGQLIAIGLVAGFAFVLINTFRRRPGTRLVQGFGAVLILAGLIGASILVLQGDANTSETEAAPQVASSPSTTSEAAPAAAAKPCRVTEERVADEFGGGHPSKLWFGPTEDAPEQDLGHVVGDGFVIARYRADLPAAQVQALREKLNELGPKNVGAPAAAGQDEAFVVTTARRILRCTEPDIAALDEFSSTWSDDVNAGRIQ